MEKKQTDNAQFVPRHANIVHVTLGRSECEMKLAFLALIVLWIASLFPPSLQYLANDPGNIFLIGSPTQSGLTMDGPFTVLNRSDEVTCRRLCAYTKSCQAFLSFVSTVTRSSSCRFFLQNDCDPKNNATMPPQLVADITVQDGTLWLKIVGDVTPVPVNECSVSITASQTLISTSTELTSTVTEDTPPPEVPTLGQTDSSSGMQTSTITVTTPLDVSSPGSTTNSASTANTASTSSTAKTASTASTAYTASTVQTSTTALPRLPRTCNDYALNGTNDTAWTVRQIWPWTIYNQSFTNYTFAYCKFGYMAIFRNLAYYYVASNLYADQQMFFPFPSPLPDGYTADSSAKGLKTWSTAISLMNFPLLSALVQQSSRILLFEGYDKAVGFSKNCTYSGLDISPTGALSVQQYIPNLGLFNGTSINAPDGLNPPLVGAPFVFNGADFCTSFWRIPMSSTNLCNQPTNLIMMQEFQKFGNFNYRSATLAFK